MWCMHLAFWCTTLKTHWDWVTHICVSKLIIIGSDNGLLPERRQAIIWTNAGILLIGNLGTNLSQILSEIHTFSFKKMSLKMSSAKWRQFCLGLNVLNVHPSSIKLVKRAVVLVLWERIMQTCQCVLWAFGNNYIPYFFLYFLWEIHALIKPYLLSLWAFRLNISFAVSTANITRHIISMLYSAHVSAALPLGPSGYSRVWILLVGNHCNNTDLTVDVPN